MLGGTWTWILWVIGVVAAHLAVHLPYINGDESVKAHSSTEPDDLAVKIIDDLMNKSNPRVRPGVNSRNSTYVKIDFYVQSLGPLNEMEMEFATDLDFRETWVDERLSFNSTTEDPVYIPFQNTKEFWIPDIYFPNEKNGQSHDITIPNKSIRIYPNGTIRYLIRIAMRLSCTMYLANFPFDSQTCYIKISTYSYEEKEIQLRWLDCAPIEIKKSDLQLPQFHLVDYWPTKCTESYKTGNFSCLLAVFEFERMVGYYILQTYIPSVLIVILSWVAFWINKDSEPARVALGVTTVLTMTTQLTTSRSNTMRVSYLKAIDVWYATCMMFVFAALLEYAFVNACSRQEKNRNGTHKKDDDRDVEMQMLDSSETCDGKMQSTERVYFYTNWKYTSKNIDWVSRRVFPALFLFFNLVYWAYYMGQMSANKDTSKPIYCDA